MTPDIFGRIVRIVAASAAVASVLNVAIQAEDPEYTVVDLGRFTEVRAINPEGAVVGTLHTADGQTHGLLYAHGKVKDLGTLGGDLSIASGINASGMVVGTSIVVPKERRGGLRPADAFIFSNGMMQDLRALQGAAGEDGMRDAYDINEFGQIVGRGDHLQALLYSNGKTIRLGDLVPKGYCTPSRINASGQVVGTAKSSDNYEHAFLFSKGQMLDLGTLGGRFSGARDINASGEVVGFAQTKDGGHAFSYSSGKMRDLGAPSERLGSAAAGINNLGQIVGSASKPVKDDRPIPPGVIDQGILVDVHAFLYEKGRWIDLNTRVNLAASGLRELFDASAINDRGQIIGKAMAADGYHGYLLTPIATSAK